MLERIKYWLTGQIVISIISLLFSWRVRRYNERLILARKVYADDVAWGFSHVQTVEYWWYFLGSILLVVILVFFTLKMWKSVDEIGYLFVVISTIINALLVMTLVENLFQALLLVLFLAIIGVVMRIFK